MYAFPIVPPCSLTLLNLTSHPLTWNPTYPLHPQAANVNKELERQQSFLDRMRAGGCMHACVGGTAGAEDRWQHGRAWVQLMCRTRGVLHLV